MATKNKYRHMKHLFYSNFSTEEYDFMNVAYGNGFCPHELLRINKINIDI